MRSRRCLWHTGGMGGPRGMSPSPNRRKTMSSTLPLSMRLDGRAASLDAASREQLQRSHADLSAAGQHAAEAALHAAGAATDVVVAASDSVRGVVQTASGAEHLVAAGALATAGAVSWIDEKARTAVRFAAV